MSKSLTFGERCIGVLVGAAALIIFCGVASTASAPDANARIPDANTVPYSTLPWSTHDLPATLDRVEQVAVQTAPAPAPAPAPVEYAPAYPGHFQGDPYSLRRCRVEDGSDLAEDGSQGLYCVWVADEAGNGIGCDFVVIRWGRELREEEFVSTGRCTWPTPDPKPSTAPVDSLDPYDLVDEDPLADRQWYPNAEEE